MATTIEPAVAVELRELLLRVDGASAIAAEAARLAEEAQARARAAEAVALRLVERIHKDAAAVRNGDEECVG